jgi:hypothetical protein
MICGAKNNTVNIRRFAFPFQAAFGRRAQATVPHSQYRFQPAAGHTSRLSLKNIHFYLFIYIFNMLSYSIISSLPK